MNFDECAEARAVNIIDLLQINDNPVWRQMRGDYRSLQATRRSLVRAQTPFERQKVDSIHLTLRYFQRHRLAPKDHYAGSRMHP